MAEYKDKTKVQQIVAQIPWNKKRTVHSLDIQSLDHKVIRIGTR